MRTFEKGAHLRKRCAPSNQGTALDPVPLMRKGAHPPASASVGLSQSELHACAYHGIGRSGTTLPQALRRLSRFARVRVRHRGGFKVVGSAIGAESINRPRTKKEPCPEQDTAPHKRDLQLVALYRSSIFVSLSMTNWVEFVKISLSTDEWCRARVW